MTSNNYNKRVIKIADMLVSQNTKDILVTYSLGSCLGVVIYDYKLKLGGMLHAMLPTSDLEKIPEQSRTFNPYKYVDTGIDALLNRFYKRGSKNKHLSINVFGGSKIFDRDDYFNIGKRNYIAFRKAIWKRGIFIDNEHVGGVNHRTVKLNIGAGKIKLDLNKQNVILYKLTP